MGINIFLFKRKYILKLLKTSLFLTTLIIITLSFLFFKYPNKFKIFFPSLFSSNIESSTITSEETIINEIKNVNKLIPLEIELSETITLQNTYFNLDLFKKSKKVTFFANCSYSIDFSNISDNNIEINNENNEVIISISKLDIFSIDIDESKTIYDNTELGLFRFGDLKLSSEELNNIYQSLDEIFANKMNNSKFHDQALSNAESSLNELLFNLTGKRYNITIKLSQS